jgi:hypothetical protein
MQNGRILRTIIKPESKGIGREKAQKTQNLNKGSRFFFGTIVPKSELEVAATQAWDTRKILVSYQNSGPPEGGTTKQGEELICPLLELKNRGQTWPSAFPSSPNGSGEMERTQV